MSSINKLEGYYTLENGDVLYDTIGFYPYDSLKGYTQGIELITKVDSIFIDELWMGYFGWISDEFGKYHIMKTFTAHGKKYMENWHYCDGKLVKIIYHISFKDEGNSTYYGRIGKQKF